MQTEGSQKGAVCKLVRPPELIDRDIPRTFKNNDRPFSRKDSTHNFRAAGNEEQEQAHGVKNICLISPQKALQKQLSTNLLRNSSKRRIARKMSGQSNSNVQRVSANRILHIAPAMVNSVLSPSRSNFQGQDPFSNGPQATMSNEYDLKGALSIQAGQNCQDPYVSVSGEQTIQRSDMISRPQVNVNINRRQDAGISNPRSSYQSLNHHVIQAHSLNSSIGVGSQYHIQAHDQLPPKQPIVPRNGKPSRPPSSKPKTVAQIARKSLIKVAPKSDQQKVQNQAFHSMIGSLFENMRESIFNADSVQSPGGHSRATGKSKAKITSPQKTSTKASYLRSNATKMYQAKLALIEQNKQRLRLEQQRKEAKLKTMEQKQARITQKLELMASLDMAISSLGGSKARYDVLAFVENYIAAIKTDVFKNKEVAVSKMKQEEQDFLKKDNQNARVRQLKMLEGLMSISSQGGFLPLAHLTPMKRIAKGVKPEVKEAIRQACGLAENEVDFELISSLRSKPYLKPEAESSKFRYEVAAGSSSSEIGSAFFPPLYRILESVPSIIEVNLKQKDLTSLKDKIELCLVKQKKSRQGNNGIKLELEKMAKLQEPLLYDGLGVFRDCEYQCLDPRVYKLTDKTLDIQNQPCHLQGSFQQTNAKNKQIHFVQVTLHNQNQDVTLQQSTVSDLVKTQEFLNYFRIQQHAFESSDRAGCPLFVLEKASQDSENQQVRRLTAIEISFLALLTLSISPNTTEPASAAHQYVELKVNHASSLFSYKFNNKHDQVFSSQEAGRGGLRNKFYIVRQLIESDQNSSGDYSDDFEEKAATQPQIFKEYIVQIKKKKSPPALSSPKTDFCSWPCCLQKSEVPVQAQLRLKESQVAGSQSQNSRNHATQSNFFVAKNNKRPYVGALGLEPKQFQVKKLKRRPESSHKPRAKDVPTENQIEVCQSFQTVTSISKSLVNSTAIEMSVQGGSYKRTLGKIAALVDSELVDQRPFLKVFKKLMNSKQSNDEKEGLRLRFLHADEKKKQRRETQVVHKELMVRSGFEKTVKASLFNHSPMFENDYQETVVCGPTFCPHHMAQRNFLQTRFKTSVVFGSHRQAFQTLWRILNTQNYALWKEDLGGCLAFELLNRSSDSQGHSISQQVVWQLLEFTIHHSLWATAPFPSGPKPRQSRSGQDWMDKFHGQANHSLLLNLDDNCQAVVRSFIEQAQVLQHNIFQALENTGQAGGQLKRGSLDMLQGLNQKIKEVLIPGSGHGLDFTRLGTIIEYMSHPGQRELSMSESRPSFQQNSNSTKPCLASSVGFRHFYPVMQSKNSNFQSQANHETRPPAVLPEISSLTQLDYGGQPKQQKLSKVPLTLIHHHQINQIYGVRQTTSKANLVSNPILLRLGQQEPTPVSNNRVQQVKLNSAVPTRPVTNLGTGEFDQHASFCSHQADALQLSQSQEQFNNLLKSQYNILPSPKEEVLAKSDKAGGPTSGASAQRIVNFYSQNSDIPQESKSWRLQAEKVVLLKKNATLSTGPSKRSRYITAGGAHPSLPQNHPFQAPIEQPLMFLNKDNRASSMQKSSDHFNPGVSQKTRGGRPNFSAYEKKTRPTTGVHQAKKTSDLLMNWQAVGTASLIARERSIHQKNQQMPFFRQTDYQI